MHAGAACESCHAGGRFRGTPANCVDCHLAEYDAARNPDHRASGFPTTCETCHGTSGWEGAAFDHRFPIRSGDHAGIDCVSCHTTPGNFRAFSCIDCHEHRRSEMDDEHRGVAGYVWASPACLSCHPQGRER
jgi:hypothetical protein